MKQSKQEHPSYKETRWHLLRVEKNGSLKPFVHFRGVAMMVAGLIFVMAGAIGWLLVEWLDARGRLVAIQENVSRQNRAMEAIRNEKEGALARLAITESKLKAVVSGPQMEKENELPAMKEEAQVPPKKKTSSGNTPKHLRQKYRRRPSRHLECHRRLTPSTWMPPLKRLPRIIFLSAPVLTTHC